MEDSTSVDIKTLEFNFTQALEQAPINCDALISDLEKAHELKSYTADKLANMLQDKLIASKDVDGLIKVLQKKAEWNDNTPVFGQAILDALRQVATDRNFIKFVISSKFGKVKPTESFRRLGILRSLKQGATFFDKTWGLGEVTRVDNFNLKVYLNFPTKPDHAMSFEYAAETLKIVPESHLLAIAHRNPAAINDMIANRPGELIKSAVASFGPSTIARLQNLLDNYGIIKADDWKAFWSRARKAVASDPLVNVPPKRSDPITIRACALTYDDAWFADLKTKRNIPELFDTISLYENTEGKPATTPYAMEVLTDRLMFAINGAFLYPPPMFTRLVLLAQRLNISTPRDELVEVLLDDNRFLMAGDKLSVGEAGEMVRFIVNTRPEAVGLLLQSLPEMNYSLLKQTMEVLRNVPDFVKQLQDCTRELLASTSAPATLLVWTLRDNDWDDLKDWKLPSLYELMEHAIAICEDQAATGELLHMQHYLRDLYAKSKVEGWFGKSFAALNPLQQEALFMRLQNNLAVAEPKYQRELVKTMTAINPDLANKKVSAVARPVEAPELHYTSWRSLHARQEQFRQLVEVEIPKNTQDIAFARGYGDLRENFEYQSAKDQQRILLARREEWSVELEAMHGAFFYDTVVDFSVVGTGTEVTLEKADGTTISYSILGEWDSDEELNILPCRSRLAKLFAGKKIGEKVTIPSVVGEEEVTIKAIAPLSEVVRKWIGQPAVENA